MPAATRMSVTQSPADLLGQAELILTVPNAANLAAASGAIEAVLAALQNNAGENHGSLAESACRIGLLVEQAGRLARLATPPASSAYSPHGQILTGPVAEHRWEA